MREINVSQITDVVERLCIEANTHLPGDVKDAICKCRATEDWDVAKGVLDKIIENYEIADANEVPICQDTGMACVFLEIGQDVHLVGGNLADAVDEGVRRGYTNGYLRKSVVADPVLRGNTGDNTPAMLYTEIVPGEQIKITVGPKGFGSENMSQIRMFKPSAGLQGWRPMQTAPGSPARWRTPPPVCGRSARESQKAAVRSASSKGITPEVKTSGAKIGKYHKSNSLLIYFPCCASSVRRGPESACGFAES